MEKESIIKNIGKVASFLVLLCVSSIHGFMGMVAEMGLSIVAGSIGLAFINIDKIAKFKGAGFEAEMCEKVKHVPTGVVHKGAKGGVTACGVDTNDNPQYWTSSSEEVTCNSNGCRDVE